MKIEIATSIAKKVNLANYNGPAYESEDFFVSLKQLDVELQDEKDLTYKDQTILLTKELNKTAEEILDDLVDKRIAYLTNEGILKP